MNLYISKSMNAVDFISIPHVPLFNEHGFYVSHAVCVKRCTRVKES